MSEPLPPVTVVVVTYNGSALLGQCLPSVLAQDYPSVKVIVVDNGSDEDVAGYLQREFPGVHRVRLEKNAGFAGGNNRGIEAARGKYVALINNDAVADKAWLSAMVRIAEADDGIGAVACAILDGNRPGLLDSYGVGLALDGMSRQAMKGLPPPPVQAPSSPLLAFSGCACLLRRSALDVTGLFDESFFAYCEDTVLALRIWRSGWTIVGAPGARVTHFYSMTAGRFSLRKVFWVERNHVWLAVKNFPWCLLLCVAPATVWRHFVQAYAWLRGVGDIDRFAAGAGAARLIGTVLCAQLASLVRIPAVLVQRFRFRPPRRPGSESLLRLILQFRMSAYEIVAGARHARH